MLPYTGMDGVRGGREHFRENQKEEKKLQYVEQRGKRDESRCAGRPLRWKAGKAGYKHHERKGASALGGTASGSDGGGVSCGCGNSRDILAAVRYAIDWGDGGHPAAATRSGFQQNSQGRYPPSHAFPAVRRPSNSAPTTATVSSDGARHHQTPPEMGEPAAPHTAQCAPVPLWSR